MSFASLETAGENHEREQKKKLSMSKRDKDPALGKDERQ